jgi:MoxR-like ATPase
MKLSMGYPEKDAELTMLDEHRVASPLDTLESVCTTEDVVACYNEVREVNVSDKIKEYIIAIINESRTSSRIRLGASPRGTLALMRASQAYAAMDGRDYVIPDDVLAVFPDVCAHRIWLEAKARLHELSAEEILSEITKKVKKPEITEFKIK